MGRAAQRKHQRIKIDAEKYFRLKTAIAQRDLFLRTVELELHKQDALVGTAMRNAGLEPAKHYKLDDETLTATVQ